MWVRVRNRARIRVRVISKVVATASPDKSWTRLQGKGNCRGSLGAIRAGPGMSNTGEGGRGGGQHPVIVAPSDSGTQ